MDFLCTFWETVDYFWHNMFKIVDYFGHFGTMGEGPVKLVTYIYATFCFTCCHNHLHICIIYKVLFDKQSIKTDTCVSLATSKLHTLKVILINIMLIMVPVT